MNEAALKQKLADAPTRRTLVPWFRVRYGTIAVVSAVILYLVLATGSALTRLPLADEVFYASPAYNLVRHGFIGMTMAEPSPSMPGIDRYVYAYPPLHILAQAVWYKLSGFGLFQMRLHSVLWGLVALASWYVIVSELTGERVRALWAFCALAVDYTFVMSASLGRLDMMSAALGWCGIAVYLFVRRRSFALAILGSQTLCVAAGLTHPLGGILAWLALAAVILLLDRGRLRLKHLGLAAVPYLVGAAAWGAYIAQSPDLFRAQFLTAITQANRQASITGNLATTLGAEIWRYLGYYGLGAKRDPRALLFVIYAAGTACAVFSVLRRRRPYRMLMLLGALTAILLYFADGSRQRVYIIFVTPYATVLISSFLYEWYLRRPRIVLAVCAGIVFLHTGMVAYRLWLNPYGRQYKPAMDFVRERTARGAYITGTMVPAFELGFDANVRQDWALGYYTKKHADAIVVDVEIKNILSIAQVTDPAAERYARRLLESDYTKAFSRGDFDIYLPR